MRIEDTKNQMVRIIKRLEETKDKMHIGLEDTKTKCLIVSQRPSHGDIHVRMINSRHGVNNITFTIITRTSHTILPNGMVSR